MPHLLRDVAVVIVSDPGGSLVGKRPSGGVLLDHPAGLRGQLLADLEIGPVALLLRGQGMFQ